METRIRLALAKNSSTMNAPFLFKLEFQFLQVDTSFAVAKKRHFHDSLQHDNHWIHV